MVRDMADKDGARDIGVEIAVSAAKIEEKCINLIAAQQPIASDLRLIVAVLNILTELERIGDYAEGIAKIVIMIGDEAPLKIGRAHV